MESIDNRIIEAAQKGNIEATGQLFEYYQPSVYRFLYYRTSDHQTAEDLTSEVFIKIVKALPSYHLQNIPFEAWVFQIARNLAIDHYRKSSTHMNVEMSIEDEELQENDANSPDTLLDNGLNSEYLKKGLESLTYEQRDVLVLRFVNGMPIAQVAKLLKKSEDAIKGLQRRGLIALRNKLIHMEIT
jgi:RNA polymerase sigma-70 factor, ECF subfamily